MGNDGDPVVGYAKTDQRITQFVGNDSVPAPGDGAFPADEMIEMAGDDTGDFRQMGGPWAR